MTAPSSPTYTFDPCHGAQLELAAAHAAAEPYFPAQPPVQGRPVATDAVPTDIQRRIVDAERVLLECQQAHAEGAHAGS